MDYVALGKRIRAKRRSYKMTQEQLSEKSGISLSFLGHIERGSRKASLETIVSLCNALLISPSSLLQDSLSREVLMSMEETSAKNEVMLNEITRVILENYNS